MALTTTVSGAEPTRDLGRLTWILVVAALAAATTFAVVVASGDGTTTAGPAAVEAPTPSAHPQGSPDAIERRALAEEGFGPTTRTAVERGSIAALDHEAATAPAARGFATSTQPFVDRGSITAIDHRAEVDG